MTQEDYVSFETAKLLKEKGFDEGCRAFYVKSKECGIELFYAKEPNNYNDNVLPCTSAPTLQMAAKWLREKHNLHIGVLVTYQYLPRKYEVHVMHTEKCEDIVVHPGTNFNTNEEACEDAIKYCLENLV